MGHIEEASDTVLSDKENLSPNLLTFAWPSDLLIVFISSNNFKSDLAALAACYWISKTAAL